MKKSFLKRTLSSALALMMLAPIAASSGASAIAPLSVSADALPIWTDRVTPTATLPCLLIWATLTATVTPSTLTLQTLIIMTILTALDCLQRQTAPISRTCIFQVRSSPTRQTPVFLSVVMVNGIICITAPVTRHLPFTEAEISSRAHL